MKNTNKIIGIVALAVVSALMFFKLATNKQTTDNRIYQYDKEKPIAVSTDTVLLQNIIDAVSFSGTFEPNKETKISAEVQGKINAITADAGSYVRPGQSIIQLDNSLLKLQLQAAQVQIEGLEADVKRFTILAEADAVQGLQLEKAKLGLKSAQVQKSVLEEQIRKTTISAPFGGVVTAKLTEVGAFAAPGVPLLQITDIGTLRFTVNVSEGELTQFLPNQSYRISADIFPDLQLNGKIISMGSKANIGNRFQVLFQVDNTKERTIKAGMFGKVYLGDIQQKQGILIPTSAIVEDAGTASVYLAKNGKAVRHKIDVAKTIGSNSVINSGLAAGDIIISKGFINLFDNANINIK